MLGIGTDIVAVARIDALRRRHGERFLARCFRPEELAVAAARPGTAGAAALAARWAAKEAFRKALALPLLAFGWRDVEVVREADGRPRLRLHGRAAEALAAAGGTRVLVSLSHERDYAVAVVAIE